jgi:putative SOS response-associated peptidase YedK
VEGILAQSANVTAAPAFREAIKYRRCLVPACLSGSFVLFSAQRYGEEQEVLSFQRSALNSN